MLREYDGIKIWQIRCIRTCWLKNVTFQGPILLGLSWIRTGPPSASRLGRGILHMKKTSSTIELLEVSFWRGTRSNVNYLKRCGALDLSVSTAELRLRNVVKYANRIKFIECGKYRSNWIHYVQGSFLFVGLFVKNLIVFEMFNFTLYGVGRTKYWEVRQSEQKW